MDAFSAWGGAVRLSRCAGIIVPYGDESGLRAADDRPYGVGSGCWGR